MHKFKLEVSERQVYIIQEALDLYGRLLFGQIEPALWSLFISKGIDRDEFEKACEKLKSIVFPHLPKNTAERPKDRNGEKLQVAFEMHGVIRHEIWKRKEDAPKHVVAADLPLHYSSEALIKFEDVEVKKPLNRKTQTEFERQMKIYIRKFAVDKQAASFGQYVFEGKTYWDYLSFYDALIATNKIPAMSDELILEYCEK